MQVFFITIETGFFSLFSTKCSFGWQDKIKWHKRDKSPAGSEPTPVEEALGLGVTLWKMAQRIKVLVFDERLQAEAHIWLSADLKTGVELEIKALFTWNKWVVSQQSRSGLGGGELS